MFERPAHFFESYVTYFVRIFSVSLSSTCMPCHLHLYGRIYTLSKQIHETCHRKGRLEKGDAKVNKVFLFFGQDCSP